MTEYQKNFLLDYFFKNEEYAGWKNIALALLVDGQCVVAGGSCIWTGGIGNFIKTEEAEDFIGCVKYIFDLETFLTSEWFKEIHDGYTTTLAWEKANLDQKYAEICKL